MSITKRLSQGKHYKEGCTCHEIRAMAKSINRQLLDQIITFDEAKAMKEKVLKMVVDSHRDVIANLFLV